MSRSGNLYGSNRQRRWVSRVHPVVAPSSAEQRPATIGANRPVQIGFDAMDSSRIDGHVINRSPVCGRGSRVSLWPLYRNIGFGRERPPVPLPRSFAPLPRRAASRLSTGESRRFARSTRPFGPTDRDVRACLCSFETNFHFDPCSIGCDLP